MVLPSVSSDDLRIFLDGTGRAFVQFMDSVLRASAAKLRIPAADVHTNLKISVPDGGVDSQIDRGGDDQNGRLVDPTLWQYKAQRLAEIGEAAIREEILGASKENARELIRRGYAYRLCICDDATPP